MMLQLWTTLTLLLLLTAGVLGEETGGGTTSARAAAPADVNTDSTSSFNDDLLVPIKHDHSLPTEPYQQANDGQEQQQDVHREVVSDSMVMQAAAYEENDDQSRSHSPHFDNIHRGLDLSTNVLWVDCPSVSNSSDETWIMVEYFGSDSFTTRENLYYFLSNETVALSALSCDAGQRRIYALLQEVFVYTTVSADFYRILYRVAFNNFLDDTVVKTLTEAPGTLPNTQPAWATEVVPQVLCSVEDVLADTGDNCTTPNCFCPAGELGDPSNGFTEQDLTDVLNDSDNQDAYENRDPINSLFGLDNVTQVRELIQHDCEPGEFDFRRVVLYIDVDPCSYPDDSALKDLDLALTEMYNEQALQDCDEAFPRLNFAQVMNQYFECKDNVLLDLQNNQDFNGTGPGPRPTDGHCFPWIIGFSYDTSNSSSPLFFDDVDSTRQRRNLQEDPVYQKQRLEHQRERERIQKQRLQQLQQERQQLEMEEQGAAADGANRDLYVAKTSFPDAYYCFCAVHGAQTEPMPGSFTLTEFTALALPLIQEYYGLAETPQSCTASVFAADVDCGYGPFVNPASSTEYHYFDLEENQIVTDEILQEFEEACLDYNQIVFEDCPVEHAQIYSCRASRLFDLDEVNSQPGFDVLLDNRLVLEIVGFQVNTGNGNGFDFFDRSEETGSPLATNIFGGLQGATRRRNLLHRRQDDQVSVGSSRSHNNDGTRGLFYFVFPIAETSSGCFCLDKPGETVRAEKLPTLEQVFPPFVRQSYIVKEDCSFPHLELQEDTLYIGMIVGGDGSFDVDAFRRHLQVFLNDFAVGRIDGTCSNDHTFVFNVKEEASPSEGIFAFTLQYSKPDVFGGEDPPPGPPVEDSYFRRLTERNNDQQRLLPTTPSSCYCVEGTNLTSHSPDALNEYFFEYISDPGRFPQITQAQILDDSGPIFQPDTSVESCPDPDEEFSVLIGIRLNQTEAPDEQEQEQQIADIRRAYTTANAKTCDSEYYRAIIPGSGIYLFFDTAQNIAMYQFEVSSRGLPGDPPLATDPPDDEEEEENMEGTVRKSRDLALAFFCTVDNILDGLSVLSDTYASFCSVPENAGSKQCSCTYDGCHCPIDGSDPPGGPTEDDVLDELQNLGNNFVGSGLNCDFPLCFGETCFCPERQRRELEQFQRRELEQFQQSPSNVSGMDDYDDDMARQLQFQAPYNISGLGEYTQQNCSNLTFTTITILVIVYIDVDPATLTQAELDFLASIVVDIINDYNAESCEPTYTRAIRAVPLVRFTGSVDTSRRLMEEDEEEEYEEEEAIYERHAHRRLDANAIVFQVEVQIGIDTSVQATAVNAFGQNLGRRRMGEEWIEQLDAPMNEIIYYDEDASDWEPSEDRRLVTITNEDGTVECYCRSHVANAGLRISLEIFLQEFNRRQNITEGGAVTAVDESCVNSTDVEFTSSVMVTLTRPYSELTDDEKFEMESAFVQNHNDLTLLSCGPDSSLIIQAILVPFPDVGDIDYFGIDPPDGDPASVFEANIHLAAIDFIANAPNLELGESVYLLPSEVADIFGDGGGRRMSMMDDPAFRIHFPRDLSMEATRKLQDSTLCWCLGGNEDKLNLADVMAGVPNVIDAEEIVDVPCEDGIVDVYFVAIRFSETPTESQVTRFERVFAAYCNFVSVSQCDESLWQLLLFEYDPDAPPLQSTGGPPGSVTLPFIATVASYDYAGDSGDNEQGNMDAPWLTFESIATTQRRVLLEDGLAGEVVSVSQAYEPLRRRTSRQGNSKHSAARRLQQQNVLLRETISNFTGEGNCSCSFDSVILDENGIIQNITFNDVAVDDVNFELEQFSSQIDSLSNFSVAPLIVPWELQPLVSETLPSEAPSAAPSATPTRAEQCLCEPEEESMYEDGKKGHAIKPKIKKKARDACAEGLVEGDDGYLLCGDTKVIPFGLIDACGCGDDRSLQQKIPTRQTRKKERRVKKDGKKCEEPQELEQFRCPASLTSALPLPVDDGKRRQ